MANKIFDIAGKKFGKLFVTDKFIRKRYLKGKGGSELKRLCICDCGKEKHVLTANLINGSVKSCGCLRIDLIREKSKVSARNRIFRGYVKSAEYRKINWCLSNEDFDNLIFSNCYYCGIEPCTSKRTTGKYTVEIYYNGIDRIDNNLGYITSNCVACCKICNRAKSDLNIKEFMLWIERIKRQS